MNDLRGLNIAGLLAGAVISISYFVSRIWSRRRRVKFRAND